MIENWFQDDLVDFLPKKLALKTENGDFWLLSAMLSYKEQKFLWGYSVVCKHLNWISTDTLQNSKTIVTLISMQRSTSKLQLYHHAIWMMAR